MTVGRETGEQETVHLFCEQRRTERHGGAGGGVQGRGAAPRLERKRPCGRGEKGIFTGRHQ